MGEEKISLDKKIRRNFIVEIVSLFVASSSLLGLVGSGMYKTNKFRINPYKNSESVVTYYDARETLDKLNEQRNLITNPLDYPYLNEDVKKYQDFKAPNLEEKVALDSAIASVGKDVNNLKSSEDYKLYKKEESKYINSLKKRFKVLGPLFLLSFFSFGGSSVNGYRLKNKIFKQGEKKNA
jgi:hypothetical protein